jgi:3-hydroxyisobutyrate dehydrogenase-like beta-hydroxyacid dehydrogenase
MIQGNLGILHPGEMGITVALAAQNSGMQIFWASEGRSPETRARAEKIELGDAVSLVNLCGICSILICVCPPSAALEVAEQVAVSGYRGLYIEANAISPQLSRQIGQFLREAGISYVDGSIIGPPAWKENTTRLKLSGKQAEETASCFDAGPLAVNVIGDSIGQASALKMCYAAYTKGTSALLCAILAAAEALEVRDELSSEWSRSGSSLADEAGSRARRASAKAWRFEGEMEQIASTFDSVGIPDGFHLAAAEIYSRLSDFKDRPQGDLDKVLSSLLQVPHG